MKAKAIKPKATAQLPLNFIAGTRTEKLLIIKELLQNFKFSQANKVLAMYKELNNNK